MTRISTDRALEAAAVVLSVAYTWLYLRGLYPLCYLPAFVGSVIFGLLCYRKKLYAETFLHGFYVVMAVYGAIGIDAFARRSLELNDHLTFIVAGAAGTLVTGGLLKRHTDARLPYIDGFTTIYSLIATWLMVNYIHENWLYWIIIDAVAIFLYAYRRMYLGALLFVLYLFMAFDGYFHLHWF